MTDAGRDAPASSAPTATDELPVDRHSGGVALLAAALVALVAGAGLVATARVSALALLIAIAVLQAAFGVGWVMGTSMPGRKGALVLAAMAAGGADAALSVWPRDRLGPLLAVVGLAVPVMFVHQLMRGAARVQLVSSLSAVAVLVLGQVSLAALLQIRHEFAGNDIARRGLGDETGGKVAAAVAGAALAAVLVGCLADVVAPVPRFDPDVPRGMLGLLASAAVGAAVAHLVLKDVRAFADGRALFFGGAVGGLAALVAVAAAFVHHTTPPGRSWPARWGRPVVTAVLPVAVVAPAAFLLCLAIRT
ncbi:hypothetical protein [Jatrophihabitans fulvus]